MEDALARKVKNSTKVQPTVLILVVMEDALAPVMAGSSMRTADVS